MKQQGSAQGITDLVTMRMRLWECSYGETDACVHGMMYRKTDAFCMLHNEKLSPARCLRYCMCWVMVLVLLLGQIKFNMMTHTTRVTSSGQGSCSTSLHVERKVNWRIVMYTGNMSRFTCRRKRKYCQQRLTLYCIL